MRCPWKTNFSSVPRSRTLVCSFTLARGRAGALLSSKRWPLHHRCASCNVAAFVLCSFGTMENSALFAVLQAGDGHSTSWTAALRRDLAWLNRTGGCGEFSDPHDGDCSDWVASGRDKPAQWNTRVKRAARRPLFLLRPFPVYGFPVQPTEMLTYANVARYVVVMVA